MRDGVAEANRARMDVDGSRPILALLPDRKQNRRCCAGVVRFTYQRLYGSSDRSAKIGLGRR